MKKIGLFTLAAALVAFAGIAGSGVANADTYTFGSASNGTYSYTGTTFTFAGTATVSDITSGKSFLDTYDFTGTSTPAPAVFSSTTNALTNVTLSFGSGAYLTSAFVASGTAYAFPSGQYFSLGSDYFAPTYNPSIVTGQYNGTITAPPVAPETSSVVAFGAMLAAGGLLLFAAKRRSSSSVA
jgi:hypothetical protein